MIIIQRYFLICDILRDFIQLCDGIHRLNSIVNERMRQQGKPYISLPELAQPKNDQIARECPDIGKYCKPIYENVDKGEECKTVNTKQGCVSLMVREYPCTWNPYYSLPNSNLLNPERTQFVGDTQTMSKEERTSITGTEG